MAARNWILPTLLALSGCGDECRSYSDFSCSQISKADYNVYFYMPNGNEVYLGKTEGLQSCGAISWDYAAQKNISRSADWGYICCMIAKGSSCYEKHR